MSEQGTPRSVLRSLLQGEQAARPLLIPLTFSLAARLENLALGSFAASPTKIVNALRQVRSSLRLDGVTCYFDPFLEVEALGGKIEWTSEGARLLGPVCTQIEELRLRCQHGESILGRGRIPVVAEVLKRLRILLKDDPALVVALTGPVKLATLLAGTPEQVPPTEAIEFAAEVTATVSKHFVEAGADVIFLRETLPTGDSAIWQGWRGLLEPVINVVRFYEALPVLLLDEGVTATQASRLLEGNWECVTCLTASLAAELSSQGENQNLGLALPTTLFASPVPGEADIARFCKMIENLKPVLVTTTMDLPGSADLKQVARLLGQFRQALSSAA